MKERTQNDFTPLLKLLLSIGALLGLITLINIGVILNMASLSFTKPLKRALASTPTISRVTHEKAPEITFNCKKPDEKHSLKTEASSARMIFKNCNNIKYLINSENQSEGHLFHLKKGRVTSDFIHLSPGSNTLNFRYGETSKKVHIQRAEKKNTKHKVL